jgi:hypothetical protein
VTELWFSFICTATIVLTFWVTVESLCSVLPLCCHCQQRKEKEKDEVLFPDEVDVDPEAQAKDRFARSARLVIGPCLPACVC